MLGASGALTVDRVWSALVEQRVKASGEEIPFDSGSPKNQIIGFRGISL
jgi:hypothetical protein